MKIFVIFSLVLYLVLTTNNLFCDASKILVVFPFSAKSHHYFLQPIVKELAKRGHEVTYYTPNPIGKNITNIKEVYLSDPVEELFGGEFSFEMLQKIGQQQYLGFPGFIFMSLGISRIVLKNPDIKQLISSDEKYDIVLSELFFGQEPLVALGHKFNAPVVAVQPFTSTYFSNEFTGNPMGAAYIPCLEVPYTDEMTFFQRLHNSLRIIISHLVSYLYYYPKQDRLMRETFVYPGSEEIPPLTDMLQELSLVIINSQTAIDYAKPLVPNMIPVAGTHISSQRQPLPKDLKQFMDDSKNGVVYFSLGSVIPSEQFPDSLKNIFIKAFSKLKQNVLWKLPDDKMTGLPKNIKISKWLPQHDILAHPNCIAFITHGGLLSHEEAVYFGVPFIGIPFFADQPINVNRAVKRGFGINLNFYNITEESLNWALNEILYKKSYQENIKRYSKVFHDNPLPPSETAAYWIEYVLRHNGAPHLRSEGRKLPYYKYLLLDVAAFIIAILILITFVSYKIVKLILCKFCSKSCKQNVKSSKKTN